MKKASVDRKLERLQKEYKKLMVEVRRVEDKIVETMKERYK